MSLVFMMTINHWNDVHPPHILFHSIILMVCVCMYVCVCVVCVCMHAYVYVCMVYYFYYCPHYSGCLAGRAYPKGDIPKNYVKAVKINV